MMDERVSYSKDFSSGLQRMRKTGKFCDVVLVTEPGDEGDTHKFPAHKVVLSALSVYFDTMFQSHFVEESSHEIQMEITPEQCSKLLDFMYTGSIAGYEVHTVIDMLYLSNQYQIESLRKSCQAVLLKSLDSHHCVRIWEASRLLLEGSNQMELKDLEEKASIQIAKEFALISSDEDFLCLNRVDFISSILKNPEINAVSETVVKAGLHWIEYDFEHREQYVSPVLESLQVNRNIIDRLVQNFEKLSSSAVLRAELSKYEDICSAHTTKEECFVVIGGNQGGSNRSLVCFGFRQKKWFTLAPMPAEPGCNFAICTQGSRLYLSGGTTANTSSQFYVYNGELNEWQNLRELPEARHKHCMASSNNFIVVLGGEIPTKSHLIKEIDIYHPDENKWSEHKSDLVKPVKSSICFVLQDKIYLFGGYSQGSKYNKVQYFDAKNGYTAELIYGTTPNELLLQSRVVVMNDTVLAISTKGTVYMFNDRHNEFQFNQKSEVKLFPRKGFGVCIFSNNILITGGEVDYMMTKDMIQHKPEDNFTFSMQETLPHSLSHFCFDKIIILKDYLNQEVGSGLMTT